MLVSVQLFDDVARHQDIEGSFVVIPIQFDAAVVVTCTILGKGIYCFNRCNQMVNILLTLVYHSKIVNNKVEDDGAHHVFPEAWGILAFVITVGGETLAKELVGKDASLRQFPDGFSHLEVDVASNDLLLEVVLGNDLRWKQTDGHLHVFVLVEHCCEVEIFNVEAHVTHLWGATHTIPVELGGHHDGGACGMFPMIIDQISSSCDSNLYGSSFCGRYATTTLA
jgi:hypothetical protein